MKQVYIGRMMNTHVADASAISWSLGNQIIPFWSPNIHYVVVRIYFQLLDTVIFIHGGICWQDSIYLFWIYNECRLAALINNNPLLSDIENQAMEKKLQAISAEQVMFSLFWYIMDQCGDKMAASIQRR